MKNKIVVAFLVIVIFLIVVIASFSCYNNLFCKNTEWTITQYGNDDDNGLQMMFFSIEGNKNGLILIDGGYEDSPEQVKRVKDIIQKHDNKVDAWIVTHLDSDHAGVFINIYENNPDIEIKNVYTQTIPELDKVIEKAPWEESWETYEKFCSLDINNLKELSEGDCIEDLIGLKLETFWSYTDWIYENSGNLLNNGSLVFKVNGNEENMLFCSDVQNAKVGDFILEKYSERLKSDYLQVGHHGNNKFSKDFYKVVSPKGAFICAPDYIINNLKSYKAGEIKKQLEDDGVKIYSDSSAPNSIILK